MTKLIETINARELKNILRFYSCHVDNVNKKIEYRN